jgi:hypothetical protein
MKLIFQTKEESNAKQREAFLKLSGAERLVAFFELSRKINRFPLKVKIDKTIGNFIIEKKK